MKLRTVLAGVSDLMLIANTQEFRQTASVKRCKKDEQKSMI